MNDYREKQNVDAEYLARTFYAEASERLGIDTIQAFLQYIRRHGRRFTCGCTFGGQRLPNVMASRARGRLGQLYWRFRCLRHHRAGAAESMKRRRRRAAAARARRRSS